MIYSYEMLQKPTSDHRLYIISMYIMVSANNSAKFFIKGHLSKNTTQIKFQS